MSLKSVLLSAAVCLATIQTSSAKIGGGGGGKDKSNSGPLNTCERQAQCAEFEVFKSPSPILCNDKTCEFEVCLRLYQKEGGNCPSSISHSCQKPVIMCKDDTAEMQQISGFPKTYDGEVFAKETQGPALTGEGYSDCQVVGPNQLVEFLIKDGAGCAASGSGVSLPTTSGAPGATCAPRPASTESCTGNAENVECIWTFRTPDCDGNYEGGSAKDPETEELEAPTDPEETPIEPDDEEEEGDSGASVRGDPHFKTWAGEKYDFHGICDLVLLQNPQFQNGLGMDINVRSKKTRQWSFVSAAVLRIGKDTLEITGAKDGNSHWINGVQSEATSFSISGYPVTMTTINSQSREYVVGLDMGEKIKIRTWKDFVRVDINWEDSKYLAGSVGLMGSFPSGAKLARDNKTVMDDVNMFGQEWQVHADEPMLFHMADGIQAPAKCEIPSSSAVRRQLAESSITLEEAQIACARVSEGERDLCIFDVMATNDKESAGAY